MNRINCVGDICPVPVIKAKKALADINASSFDGLEIVVDNEIAVQNISKLLNSLGCSFSTSKEESGHFLIQISEYGSSAEPMSPHSPPSKIVVIASEIMGAGDDALGKMLMKGFIFAMTQLESLPKAVIFYNSGVRLALKDSESITDLQYLLQQGVKILSCGMCLNHFNALADLAVGKVTDMYSIVNLMQQSACIIRP